MFNVSVFGFLSPGFVNCFRVGHFGFDVSGLTFWVSGFGFRVSGFGFRVSDFGFRTGEKRDAHIDDDAQHEGRLGGCPLPSWCRISDFRSLLGARFQISGFFGCRISDFR